MNAPRVKPLVWQNDMLFCGQPHAYADMPLGPWTVTAYDRRGGKWAYDDPSGDTSDMDWPTREEAQAAAQADYETRILAALEPQATSAIASEAPERLWLDVKFRELFLPGEEQYGIEGLVEYRRAALEPQIAPAMAEELVALRAEVERLRACAPEQLTRAQIDSACLSYRHDYGLCTESEARHQRHECAEWFRAIRAALTPPASQEGQADA